MKVYFVRHGQTNGNKSEVHQDHSDDLDETGLQQAKKVAQRFANIKIDAILSSDYVRAVVTARAIGKVTKNEIETSELLRERRRPSTLVGKRYDDEEAIKVMKTMEENKHLSEWHYSDEENHQEALVRAQKFFKLLELRKEESILIVSHAAFMKFMLTYMIFGKDATVAQFEKIYDSFRVNNTGITICNYGEGLRGLYKKDVYWHIETWNDHSHLGELK